MTVDARTFPLPRRKRTGPASNLDALAAMQEDQAVTPPRSRVFPWLMSITGNSRRTVSTPILIGPAILRRVYFGHGTVTTPPAQSLELGWSPLAVTEAGVALATIRPYTVLTELLDPFAVANVAIGRGYPSDNSWNTNIPFEWTVDLICTEARFAFTLSWVNNGATAEQRSGTFLVVENVNPAALAAFVGS